MLLISYIDQIFELLNIVRNQHKGEVPRVIWGVQYMNSYKNFKQVFKRLMSLKFSTRLSSYLSISLLHGNNQFPQLESECWRESVAQKKVTSISSMKPWVLALSVCHVIKLRMWPQFLWLDQLVFSSIPVTSRSAVSTAPEVIYWIAFVFW